MKDYIPTHATQHTWMWNYISNTRTHGSKHADLGGCLCLNFIYVSQLPNEHGRCGRNISCPNFQTNTAGMGGVSQLPRAAFLGTSAHHPPGACVPVCLCTFFVKDALLAKQNSRDRWRENRGRNISRSLYFSLSSHRTTVSVATGSGGGGGSEEGGKQEWGKVTRARGGAGGEGGHQEASGGGGPQTPTTPPEGGDQEMESPPTPASPTAPPPPLEESNKPASSNRPATAATQQQPIRAEEPRAPAGRAGGKAGGRGGRLPARG